MTSSVNDCKRIHQIEVECLREGDTVRHSLLLIKGRLLPSCSSAKQLKATLALRQTRQEQLTQLSAVGEFKLLFDLSANEQLKEEKEKEQDKDKEQKLKKGQGKEPEPKQKEKEEQNKDKEQKLKERQEEERKPEPCVLELRCCSVTRLLQFSYHPRLTPFRVQPLYLLCREDKEAEKEQQGQEQLQRERCSIIDLNLRLVQCIYAHKLYAAGYANRTFSLNGACRIFRSQLSCSEARAHGEDELWQRFATEILACPHWGKQRHLKFAAFIGCTRYDGAAVAASGDHSYANIRRHLGGHAALGGGGLALFGTGHFYAWPRRFAEIGDCIRSTERVDVTRLPDESNYRRTYGGVYASTLGAVCHELGHCFDLGHTSDGVMGDGFDYLNRVLTIDQPTEHLPHRLVSPAEAATSLVRPRFTPLNLKHQAGSKYLDSYHAQRRNDSFYFAHNCAVILAQHRWLRPDSQPLPACPQLKIDLLETGVILSSLPLRLVELRCKRNSLVAYYEEFQELMQALRYQLPASLWNLMATQRTHYAFVLTIDGNTKRLACEKPAK